jgi:methyl-galactoside transport system substrate-binding protein
MITYTLVGTINVNAQSPIKVGVFLYSFDDPYASLVKKALEDIQMKNEGKVEFIFYDSKNNQAVQNANIDNLIQTGNADILFVDLVKRDTESAINVLKMTKARKIPVVFTFVNSEVADAIKSYDKTFVVGTDIKQAGDLQGNIIIDIWNTNKASIDKNNDDILQYVLLEGSNEPAGKQRVLYYAGIKTKTTCRSKC